MISKIKTKLHGLNGEYTLKVECESSAKDAIEKERNDDVGAIALRDGKCFCCAYCRKIWLNARKNKRRKERQMNKIMEKFGG